MGGALVTLREGLEAALIVGIVLAYVAKTGNRDHFPAIWAGVAAALAISAITGAALFFTVGELEGRAEELFEGVAMLAAVCVLTWMIFWMRRQAVAIRGELEAKVAAAVAAGSALALASVVFFAVLREGWETALFLFAVTEGTSPLATGIGASLGLLVSVALGIALYRGSHRLNLRQFFAFTGTLLIGKFLTALFGYNGDPRRSRSRRGSSTRRARSPSSSVRSAQAARSSPRHSASVTAFCPVPVAQRPSRRGAAPQPRRRRKPSRRGRRTGSARRARAGRDRRRRARAHRRARPGSASGCSRRGRPARRRRPPSSSRVRSGSSSPEPPRRWARGAAAAGRRAA